jgi:S1-C subfamily serine protease
MRKLLLILAVLVLLFAVGQKSKVLPNIDFNKYFSLPKNSPLNGSASSGKTVIVSEESVITKVVQDSLPSVVTIGIKTTNTQSDNYQFDPFNPFGPLQRIPSTQKQPVEQNIGSGFIISQDGLVITNKHVVSDTDSDYEVLTNDNKKYPVDKIYRDPLNDLAILKINASGLTPLKLGDSSTVKLGQLAIAIGTPLGEFRNTVTSGIISGLGRGISAGSPYEESVEKLDNVIQTDAAISPGNSGGPLLNSSGQVVGINTAVASQGQNIGFAIPSNVIRDLIDKFNKQGGSFERPYIGVRYKLIDKQSAIMNDVVEGAYVIQVIQGSPADKAGIQEEDIITQFDGQKVQGTDDQGLAKMILEKKVGDQVKVTIWRNGKTQDLTLTLDAAK